MTKNANITRPPATGRRPHRSVRALVASLAVLGVGAGLVACNDDDNDVDDPPSVTDPVDDTNDFDESAIVGLPVDEAREVVEAQGRDFRVAVIDGEDQVLTTDFVEDRVNVAVSDGVVEGVEFIG